MYPHRAWDPGLDPQAGRGYGQQQPGQQAQGQSASGTWQDQVRGNPAAEYAALMQSRAADGTERRRAGARAVRGDAADGDESSDGRARFWRGRDAGWLCSEG